MEILESLEEQFQGNELITNFYRRKQIGDNYLLTTEHGTWVYLSKDKYEKFLRSELDDQTKEDLINRGIYITKDNINNIVEQQVGRIKVKANGAGLHILVPTIRCNLRCVYCHSEAHSITDGNEYDMTQETLKKTLEFIFKSPNKIITIEFQGGEPLLNKDIIRKTVEYAEELNKKYQKQYQLALVTNLLNLDEEFLDFIIQHKDKIHITSSLDGPKHVHDLNRRFVHSNVGSYDQVVKKLQMCKDKGIHVGLLMVTTRYSLHYWKEIIQEYLKWGIHNIQIKPLDYLGYAREVWNEIGYTMDEFVNFWRKSTDYMFEILNDGQIIIERRLKFAIDTILQNRDTGFLDWTNPCGLLRGQTVYDYNGDIYCCDEARVIPDSVLGSVYTEYYEVVINKEKSKKWMEAAYTESYYCDACVYKTYCGVCPVLHYGQEENYMIKLNKTNRCQLNKAVLDYVFDKIINDGNSLKRMLIGVRLGNQLNL